ncbi:MAG: hypothetical protein L0I76_09950 [Pseudonocardia sp.]|nr:hypothetical protein [Pseudonocardia sp.]
MISGALAPASMSFVPASSSTSRVAGSPATSVSKRVSGESPPSLGSSTSSWLRDSPALSTVLAVRGAADADGRAAQHPRPPSGRPDHRTSR